MNIRLEKASFDCGIHEYSFMWTYSGLLASRVKSP